MMTQAGVLYDLTSFCHNPSRTGIQRVTLEVAMAWNGALPLVPFLVDRDSHSRLLPPGAGDRLAEFFGRRPGDPICAMRYFENSLRQYAELPIAVIPDHVAVFNTEVNWLGDNVRFYEGLLASGLKDRLFFFMHDILPHTHPEW